MKTIVLVVVCLVAWACGRPQYDYRKPTPPTTPATTPSPSYIPPEPPKHTYGTPKKAAPVEILVDEREGPDAKGVYKFKYEGADGTRRQEEGAPEGETGAVASQGKWGFTFPDGTEAHFTFVANAEGGYQVESDLLPTPPPLPAHAIAQIEKAKMEDAAAAAGPANTYNPPEKPSQLYGQP